MFLSKQISAIVYIYVYILYIHEYIHTHTNCVMCVEQMCISSPPHPPALAATVCASLLTLEQSPRGDRWLVVQRSEIRVRRHRRLLPAALSVRAHVTLTVISGTAAARC